MYEIVEVHEVVLIRDRPVNLPEAEVEHLLHLLNMFDRYTLRETKDDLMVRSSSTARGNWYLYQLFVLSDGDDEVTHVSPP